MSGATDTDHDTATTGWETASEGTKLECKCKKGSIYTITSCSLQVLLSVTAPGWLIDDYFIIITRGLRAAGPSTNPDGAR
jgi:hypothetical protein